MKNKKSFLMVMCLSVLLIASSLMAGKRPLSLIYPGEGIGNIRFANTLDKVTKTLGWEIPKDPRKDEQKKEYYFVYKKKGVTFVFKEDEEKKDLAKAILIKITITSPAFVTAGSSIRVGYKRTDIYDSMRKSVSMQQRPSLSKGTGRCIEVPKANTVDIICDRDGIKFIVDKKTDIVQAIEIFPPKE